DVGQVGVDIVDHRLGHRHQPERVDRDAARIGHLARIGIARIGQERIGEIVDQHAAALDLGDPDMALIVEGLPVQLVGQRALQPDDEAREFAGLIVGARAEVEQAAIDVERNQIVAVAVEIGAQELAQR
ncbi:hypothetical protein QU38_00335, partial [Staphylococcus aureus]